MSFTSNDGVPVGVPLDFDGHRVFTVDDDIHLGCPVLSKTRVLTVPRGIQGIIRWQFRDREGNAINLGDIINNAVSGTTTTTPPPSGQVIFRFANAFPCTVSTSLVHQIIGEGYNANEGWVQVEMSELLSDSPGIWRFEIAVTDSQGVPQRVDTGLLSIEHGLFPVVDASKFVGPPTINEIRIHLRDSSFENDLLGNVEFDDAEILACIIRPIQQWNEHPPEVAYFTADNFPYRHNWLDAITARLLRIGAHWYRRNNFKSSQGGVTVADRDKEREYLVAAKELDDRWHEFIRLKKLEINVNAASGSVNSTYGSGWIR